MNQIISICAHQAFIYIQNCLCAFLSAFQSINSSMLLATHLSIHPSVCPSRHLSNWTHPINNSDKAIRHIHQKRWQLVGISHPFLFLLPCPNLLHLPSLPSTIQLLFSFPQESYRNENEMASGSGEGSKLPGDSLAPGTDEYLSLKQSSGKPKEQADGQSDLWRVKSIKVHQIQNSCFLRVTNLCWKLRKTEGEKCLWPLRDRLFLPSGEPGLEWDAFMMNYNSQTATLKKNGVKRLPKRPKMWGIQPNIKINQVRAQSICAMPVQNCYGQAQLF